MVSCKLPCCEILMAARSLCMHELPVRTKRLFEVRSRNGLRVHVLLSHWHCVHAAFLELCLVESMKTSLTSLCRLDSVGLCSLWSCAVLQWSSSSSVLWLDGSGKSESLLCTSSYTSTRERQFELSYLNFSYLEMSVQLFQVWKSKNSTWLPLWWESWNLSRQELKVGAISYRSAGFTEVHSHVLHENCKQSLHVGCFMMNQHTSFVFRQLKSITHSDSMLSSIGSSVWATEKCCAKNILVVKEGSSQHWYTGQCTVCLKWLCCPRYLCVAQQCQSSAGTPWSSFLSSCLPAKWQP